MLKYYSISQFPGTTGQYYYNYFFSRYDIDATYTPLGCQPADFGSTISRLLGESDTAGISVSMPYKSAVLPYCDSIDTAVVEHQSCNTLVVSNDHVHGYNCDYAALQYLLDSKILHQLQNVSILGNGAMGKMFHSTLCSSKYHVRQINMYGRSIGNWDLRHNDADVIINCTACGTVSADSPLEYIPDSTSVVVDLSVKPGELCMQARDVGATYFSGLEFYHRQFIDQFRRYTGITLRYDDVVEAGQKR